MAIQRRIIVIAYSDGRTERLRLTPVLEMKFERERKLSMTKLHEGNAATNLYALAWTAAEMDAKQRGVVIPDLYTWAEEVEGVEMDVEDLVPTDAVQPDAGPHNSQSPPVSTPEP